MNKTDKKGTALVLGGTSDMAFAMGTFLIDLKKHGANFIDEVVIFHDGRIKEYDKKIINNIFPSKFIVYEFPIKSSTKNKFISYFSLFVFSKYEILKLLSKYDTVIWSDYDVIVLRDCSEIAEPTPNGGRMLIDDNGAAKSFIAPITEYDMNGPSMSAALIVLHDNIGDYMKMYEFCCKKTLEYYDNLYCPEQAIFNLMIQEFHLKPEHLDHSSYVMHPDDAHKHPNAKMLHSYGSKKFWSGIKNDHWEQNYAQWRALGGSSKPRWFSIFWKKVHRHLGQWFPYLQRDA